MGPLKQPCFLLESRGGTLFLHEADTGHKNLVSEQTEAHVLQNSFLCSVLLGNSSKQYVKEITLILNIKVYGQEMASQISLGKK